MGFVKEFKEFAMKGNVMDMAVGVIVGGAFGKIVTSLVDDVLMPVIGLFTGNIDFSSLEYKIKPVTELVEDAASTVGADGAVETVTNAASNAAAAAGTSSELRSLSPRLPLVPPRKSSSPRFVTCSRRTKLLYTARLVPVRVSLA